jgi:protein phosphatase 2C family protein 2/3
MKPRLKEIHKNNSSLGLSNKAPNIKYISSIKNGNIYNNSTNIKIFSGKQKNDLPELKLTKINNDSDKKEKGLINQNKDEYIYNYKNNYTNKYPTISNGLKHKSNSVAKKKKSFFLPKFNSNNYEYNDLNLFCIKNNNNNNNLYEEIITKQNKQLNTINNISIKNNRKSSSKILKETELNYKKNFDNSYSSIRNSNNNNYKANDNNLKDKPRLRSLEKKGTNRLKKDGNTKKLNHKFFLNSIPKPLKKIKNNFNENNIKQNELKDNIKLEEGKINIEDKDKDKLITNNISKEEELKEIESMTQKLNDITELLNKFSSLTSQIQIPFSSNQNISQMKYIDYNEKIPVEISPKILNQSFPNFIDSISSEKNEFSNEDKIKGYAYNSSMGNIRNYNEDEICIEKIKDNFYFFGVYDGHGGNGCSLYLKNNLYKKINDFSVESLKYAIKVTESDFLEKEAVDNNNNLKDPSGSCGIMAMIKKNKIIIGNIGDSRIVIYKKGKIEFVTEDHKPENEKEKKRIELEGGEIYQSQTLIPLYQNGKEIEIPWRVLPGRLSVSRTFGDIEAKDERFGGKERVVIAEPDIYEIEIDDEFNFMVIGCDGIFDVLSNEELLECLKIVLQDKHINYKKNIDIE